MPKLNLKKQNKYFVHHDNCGALIKKLNKIYPCFRHKLSLAELKQLLFIARAILSNNKRLSEEKRDEFHAILETISSKCRGRY